MEPNYQNYVSLQQCFYCVGPVENPWFLQCSCENVACRECYRDYEWLTLRDRRHLRCPNCQDVIQKYQDPPHWEEAFWLGMVFITPGDFEDLVARGLIEEDHPLRMNVRYSNSPRRWIVPFSEPACDEEIRRAKAKGRQPKFEYKSYEEFRALEEAEAYLSGIPIQVLWLDLGAF